MRVALIISVLLAITSCLKDEVNVNELNTNPLDQDYTGAQYIKVLSSGLSTSAGAPAHVMRLEVDDSDFPPGTNYDLWVKNLNNGQEERILATMIDGNEFEVVNFQAQSGFTYCYEFSVWVDYSTGPVLEFCDTL